MSKKFFTNRFIGVFSPDGVEFKKNELSHSIYKPANYEFVEIDGASVSSVDNVIKYSTDPLTILSYFLGLPNHPPEDKDKQQSPLNLFFNFVGWQPKASRERTIINAALMPLTILFNLIAMPFRATLNIAKLFTELLPQSIFLYLVKNYKIFSFFLSNFVGGLRHKQFGIAATNLLLFLIGASVGIIAASFSLLGFATTSPIKSIKTAHALGLKLGSKLATTLKTQNKAFRNTVGIIFAGLSLLITMSVYTVLFPFIAKLLFDPILSYAATHFSTGLVTAANTVAKLFTPFLSAIGAIMAPIAATSLNILSLGFFSQSLLYSSMALSSSAASGLGALIAIGIDTIGTALPPARQKLKQQWHSIRRQASDADPISDEEVEKTLDLKESQQQRLSRIFGVEEVDLDEQSSLSLPDSSQGRGPIRFKIGKNQLIPPRAKLSDIPWTEECQAGPPFDL